MIWYSMPLTIGFAVFFMLFTTTLLQSLIAMESGGLLRDKQILFLVRTLYGLLALISAGLSFEGLMALSSIEGGTFLPVSPFLRYGAMLPIMVFLPSIKHFLKLPARLRYKILNIFIPLLWLPLFDRLPMPLPVFIGVFAAVWFILDAIHTFIDLRKYVRSEITPDAMHHIVQKMSYGVCVINKKGWILEANPAFHNLCGKLGLKRMEHLDEFNNALETMHDSELIKINELGDSKYIQTQDSVFLLQNTDFKINERKFTQITLSDVTMAARASLELEQENEKLERDNKELEGVISEIKLEEAMNERQRLCRIAHDLWSQRLAMAGMSVDIMLDKEKIDRDILEEVSDALNIPVNIEKDGAMQDLNDTLKDLANMYNRLGVEIHVSGNGNFTKKEQFALSAVLRESLANAVRHAYARHVYIEFYEDGKEAVALIKNLSINDSTDFIEGRGLYDIRTRVQNAGGKVKYKKEEYFETEVIFPRVLNKEKEVFINAGSID